ncbi:tyrosine-type recombinase/integrase [Heliophilum fasciatum]|uniref:Integrase/recombinase XerC/integrase/recombinase XerD n=1 Tax=Heliophilum fasciatum TaxID=35700 RepID=A0A4R2R9L8_9FIRM|nr:tyrosine-type recombinase/integrase [Heliophilum fasciatum]MCW2279505.1 integrase/recombinase XerC/integrase/recombinase XerD [Heliophilum fasciatum]TCP58669.1 integrase/recombinase XerC/integrase/recombinase XerD [Heliophilum fasciatum]
MSGTLEKFKEDGLRGKSPLTIRTYLEALGKFEKWLKRAGTDLKGYSRMDVQHYLDQMRNDEKSPATIHKYLNSIRSFSRWAKKERCIEDIRAVKMTDYRRIAPKAMSRTECLRVMRESGRNDKLRDHAIIMTLLHTGIRVRELVEANRSDLTISERMGRLRIRQGKGNKERVLPVERETRRALRLYLNGRKDENPALFISNRKERISIRAVQHVVKKFGSDLHPHKFRHTMITDLMRSGADIALVCAISGHTTADMVLRYSQPTEEDMECALDKLYIERNTRPE